MADRHDARNLKAAYFLAFLGAGVFVPYFPLYLKTIGWSGAAIGVALGVHPLVRWTASIGGAWVADRFHARHRILVCGALGGTLAMPLLFAPGFVPIFAALVAIGVLHAPLIPSLDAIAMDHLERLGGDYGRLRLWGSLGFIVGAIGTGWVVGRAGPASVPWALLAPNLLLVPALARLPPAQRVHDHRLVAPWRLLTPALGAFLLTVFLLQASCGAWTGLFAVHTRALGIGDQAPGLAYGLAVCAEVLLFYFGRPLLARVAPPTLVVATVAVTVVRWMASAVVTSPPAVVGVQLGHAVTFSVFHLAAMPLLARLVPPAYATTGQALYGLMGFGAGASVGIAAAGALVDRIGTGALFGVEAVIALAAVVPARRLGRLVRHPPVAYEAP